MTNSGCTRGLAVAPVPKPQSTPALHDALHHDYNTEDMEYRVPQLVEFASGIITLSSGEMRRLYEASVRAAYTRDELQSMLGQSRLNDARSRVFKRGVTHVGIERPALAGNGD